MAFCVMQDGSTRTLKADQGIAIWEVLNGEREPNNEKQEYFCTNIRRIYLNRETAPQSYLDRFPFPGSKKVEAIEPWWNR